MNEQMLKFGIIILFFLGSAFSGCMEDKPDQEKSKENHIIIEGKGSYTSIQSAINNASENDTIIVYDGTYYEALVINKSINLIGAGSTLTFLAYDENKANVSTLILVTANSCTIEGFKISTNDSSLNINGITVDSSNNIISNNEIMNNKYGIYLSRKNDSSDNIISNNIIINNTRGIYMSTGSKNNIVSSNNVSFNTQYGIVLIYASSNIISSNNILKNRGRGVYIGYESDHNTISQNTISNNIEGVVLKGAEYNKVFSNILINNEKGIDNKVCCGTNYNTNEIYANVYR